MKKILIPLLLLTVIFIATPKAHAEDFNRRYASFNLSAGYGNDALLNAFSGLGSLFCVDTGIDCSEFIPLHNIATGANAEISLPLGKKWAFRAALGYQYVAWHSDSGTGQLKAAYNHTATADLMFDRYFTVTGKLHPYWSIGIADRHTFEIQPSLAFGMHYMVNDRTSVKIQLQGGSLLMWSFVEPSVGVAFHF